MDSESTSISFLRNGNYLSQILYQILLPSTYMIDIDRIIKENSNKSTFIRGKELNDTKKVKEVGFSIVDGEINFYTKVKGNSNYDCYIQIIDNSLEYNSCTCLYDWGGICKHTVASLLMLKNKLEIQKETTIQKKIVKASSLKQRKTTEVFEIPIKEGLDINLFLHDQNFGVAEEISWGEHYWEIENYVLEIEIADRYYYQSGKNNDAKVFITLAEDQEHILISSKPAKKVKKLRDEELAALIYIYRNRFQSIFQVLSKNSREKLILAESSKYGISSAADANKYFEIDVTNPISPVVLKPNAPNLTPIIYTQNESEISFKSLLERNFLRKQQKEKNKRSLFFYINWNEIKDIVSINPFIGRLKNTGELYATGIKRYFELNYSDSIDIDENQSKLIEISKTTIPSEFELRYGSKIRRAETDIEKSYLIAEINLASLKLAWDMFMQQGLELYICYHYTSYNLHPSDLVGGWEPKLGAELIFYLNFSEGLFHLVPKIQIGKKKYQLNSNKIKWLNRLVFSYENGLYLMNSAKDYYYLINNFEEKPSIAAVPEAFPAFFENEIKPISKHYKIEIGNLPNGMKYKQIEVMELKQSIFLKELDKFILIKPIVHYDSLDFNILEDENNLDFIDGNLVKVKRNIEIEKRLLNFLENLHPTFESDTNQGFFSLHIEDFIKDYWFLKLIEQAQDNGIPVYGFNEFKNFNYATQRPQVQVNASSGIDWFDIEVTVTVGDTNVSLKEVRKAIFSKDKYIKLGDGKLAVLPEEWVKKLEKYLRIGKVEKEKVKISKFGFNAFEDVFSELDQTEIVQEIAAKKKKLRDFKKINNTAVPELKATLRPYQLDGFNWLNFLHEFKWGGILADDMGLGKTIQVIAFLKSLVDKGMKHHLVVVPTSLLFNWKNEIEKFCPSIKFHIYHGVNREKETDKWNEFDLIITTYGIVVSDFETFKEQLFGYVILDESQAIKNPSSKRYKALVSLKSTNKLVMTGTPIENNTFDLYAQMSFANPGFFISMEHFKKNYSNPIDKESDQDVALELNNMIHPFIMRRTKALVAKELPPKTEDIIYCEMEKDQRKVYDAYRNQYRNEILGLIEDNGLENSKLLVLQALTKLRQICDSPSLLSDEENYGNRSIKIKELLSHIQERTNKHKILVFSQFVGMLALIRKELDLLEIPYAYLDGKTNQKKRKAAVDEFQEPEGPRVFLISLKAGGTGLNLTAADYVYLVDPWWNPAVENQAIDRCYRIGQDKKVIAYRMICKDTLEEKIMEYKERKQSVADSIIKTDENVMKQISKDEIMDLFS